MLLLQFMQQLGLCTAGSDQQEGGRCLETSKQSHSRPEQVHHQHLPESIALVHCSMPYVIKVAQ